MATGIHDHGKEYLQRTGLNDLSAVASVTIGLYNDTTDALAETNDLSDITTEPTGVSYARQSASLPADITFSQDGDNDIVIDFADQTYDTSDSSQAVDSYFIVVSFQANIVTADGVATDHLFFTGGLGEEINLSNWAQFTARDIKGIIKRP